MSREELELLIAYMEFANLWCDQVYWKVFRGLILVHMLAIESFIIYTYEIEAYELAEKAEAAAALRTPLEQAKFLDDEYMKEMAKLEIEDQKNEERKAELQIFKQTLDIQKEENTKVIKMIVGASVGIGVSIVILDLTHRLPDVIELIVACGSIFW